MSKATSPQPSEAQEPQSKLLLSVTDASIALQISRSSVYSLFRAGTLAFVKIGARRLVEAKELDAFIERMKASTASMALA